MFLWTYKADFPMRWHVYGTDVGTGQDVVLALDEEEATHAVQTAISKRILVSHVTQEVGEGLRRRLLPLACAVVIVLIPLCIALYVQNKTIRGRLDRAVEEQTRLAQITAQAESLASQIRQAGIAASGGGEAGGAGGGVGDVAQREETARKMGALVEQLASARARTNQIEKQLNSTYQQMTTIERTANEVPRLQAMLRTEAEALQRASAEVVRLGNENLQQRRRMEQLEKAPEPILHKLAQTEAAYKELAAQIELLKSQLLVAAAATAPAKDPDPVPVIAGPVRWAMRTSIEDATDFLRLKCDQESLRNTTGIDDAVVVSGMRVANAASLRVVHDQAKERVYSGTLTLALEGPRDKVAENTHLAAEFLRVFAPSCEKPEATLAAAVAQLTGKGRGASAPRWVLVGPDYRLSVWQSGEGVYALKVESPRVEFED
jgi:hypothetical protein